MIAGLPLPDLATLIQSQNIQKRDIVAPTPELTLVTPAKVPSLAFRLPRRDTVTGLTSNEDVVASLTPLALEQIGAWADVPTKYLRRIAQPENHDLLQSNVNHWLQKIEKKRLVRMLQDTTAIVRAFLSDTYRPLDNYDLALHIMPRLRRAGMSIKSCQLTDTRLYIQAVDMNLSAKIAPGKHQRTLDDTLYAGVVISNSEVGQGSLKIEPMVFRLVCTNGLIVGTSLRRSHLGRRLVNGTGGDDAFSSLNDAFELFSDATKEQTDKAFWMQVVDVVDAALDEARFRAVVDRMQNATTVELPPNPNFIVEVTANKLGLSSDESDLVLAALFSEGDSTLYGLMNAVTNAAEKSESYDRAIEMQRFGSDVLAFELADFSKN
jgi:hypothetical protein